MRNKIDRTAHFWKRVNIASGNACWEWQGPKNEWGYGCGSYPNLKTRIASRIAWFLTAGVLPPKGVLVCHKCDNPACCRPDHLFLGTSKDNALDRDAKGRTGVTAGEKHGMAKLKEDDILEIRRLRNAGGYLKDIGARFGVTLQMVWYITSGKNWSHVKAGANATR